MPATEGACAVVSLLVQGLVRMPATPNKVTRTTWGTASSLDEGLFLLSLFFTCCRCCCCCCCVCSGWIPPLALPMGLLLGLEEEVVDGRRGVFFANLPIGDGMLLLSVLLPLVVLPLLRLRPGVLFGVVVTACWAVLFLGGEVDEEP